MRLRAALVTSLIALTPLAHAMPTYRVTPDSPQQMQRIAERFEVLRKLDGAYEVLIQDGEEKALRALDPDAALLNPDLHAPLKALPRDRDVYDVDSMERRLKAFAERYPQLAKLDTYGTSREGRPEYVLTMAADAQEVDATKPALMITAATHGDEVITVEVVLGLMEKLLAGYGTDARLTKMLDETVIYWVPAVCVDGYARRSRYVEGRDPNRDYAWPENPSREPATQCIRHMTEFFHDRPAIKGTMDFHAAASMIMFPWAYTYERLPAEDHEVFDRLTDYMAEANGFAHGSIAETIYVAKGSSADYYYWKTGALATAIEVSHNFAPARAEIRDIVDENTESTWRFIEHFAQE